MELILYTVHFLIVHKEALRYLGWEIISLKGI